jgi:hypothetical protein
MELTIRASATPRLSLPTPSSPSSTPRASFRQQFRPISVSLPTSTTISLLALFTPSHEAKALTLSKDQMVSTLTDVSSHIFFFLILAQVDSNKVCIFVKESLLTTLDCFGNTFLAFGIVTLSNFAGKKHQFFLFFYFFIFLKLLTRR